MLLGNKSCGDWPLSLSTAKQLGLQNKEIQGEAFQSFQSRR